MSAIAPPSSSASAQRIAVIGAGIAGLVCAGQLQARGAQVTVFDKGTVPGGRAATRVTEHGNFDHGAQYFTVQSHRFDNEVAAWSRTGVVRRWSGRVIAFSDRRVIEKAMSVDRYVGAPGMNEVARHLATGLDVRLSTKIEAVSASTGRRGLWHLHPTDGRELAVGGFDALVVAVPAPQAATLLKGLTDLAAAVQTVQWAPCWAAMLALARPSGVDFDGAFINDDPILGWVARDSAKPDRAAVQGIAERWVLHAKPRWSQEYIDMAPEQAGQWLLRAFSARIGRALKPRALAAQRWRFATPVNPLSQSFLWDARKRIGLCGDWCNGPRVEGAYLSGLALADAIAV
jgi:predicted NAD/FAD-dependent oxidoreductase